MDIISGCNAAFDTVVVFIKFFLVIRIISYGTSNVSRYLIYTHGWRWHGGARPPITPDVVPTRPFRTLVPATVGVSLLGVLQWMYVKKRITPDENHNVRPASKWEVTVYTLLPLRIMSRVWGTLTSIDLPLFIRPKIISFYANSFGVNLDECQIQDLASYRNLSEFFIRPLRQECRPIDSHPHSLTSPADGRILNFGRVSSCQVDQVKGVTYSLQQFLGEPTWQEEKKKPVHKHRAFLEPEEAALQLSNDQYLRRLKSNPDNELYQCVVYLAPGDYHRFHSPVSWTVNFRRHFQGKLLSVNPAIASWIRDLFSLNERAAYVGHWQHGFFSLTAVGATNVGSIKVVFDPSLHTNRWNVKPRHRDLRLDGVKSPGDATTSPRRASTSSDDSGASIDFKQVADGEKVSEGVPMEKGELFGEFRLGSTIVLIFEAPKNFQFNVKQGQKIKYGERLGALP